MWPCWGLRVVGWGPGHRDRAPARDGHGLDQSESPPPPRHALRRTQAEWLWHRKWNGGHAGIYGSAKRLYSDDLSGRSSYLSVGRFNPGAMGATRRNKSSGRFSISLRKKRGAE